MEVKVNQIFTWYIWKFVVWEKQLRMIVANVYDLYMVDFVYLQ